MNERTRLYRERENYIHHGWTVERRRGHLYATLLREAMGYPHSSVLHVGCNSGSTLALVHELWTPDRLVALELNPMACRMARSLLQTHDIQAEVVEGSILEREDWGPLVPPHFDVILLLDVLEHIEVEDVGDLVASCSQLLRPEGRVMIFTPRYYPPSPSQVSTDPCHVRFFGDLEEVFAGWEERFHLDEGWHETRRNPGDGAPHDAFWVCLRNG